MISNFEGDLIGQFISQGVASQITARLGENAVGLVITMKFIVDTVLVSIEYPVEDPDNRLGLMTIPIRTVSQNTN